MIRETSDSIKRVLTFLNKGLISHEDWAAYLKDGKEEPAYVGNLATHEWYIAEYRYARELVNGIERLLAEERELMECGHFKACLSPITVEYRDGTLEEAQECSFCVQLKDEREVAMLKGSIVELEDSLAYYPGSIGKPLRERLEPLRLKLSELEKARVIIR